MSGHSGPSGRHEVPTAAGEMAAMRRAMENMMAERLKREFLTDADDVKKMAEIMSAVTMRQISKRWLS